MKFNELNVDDDNSELWIELEGKLVKIGQSYLKKDGKSGQTKLVMVPIKPRQRAKLIKKGETNEADQD